MMVDIFNKIQESKSYILNKARSTPSVGIILGTGLGDLINEIEEKKSIHYSEIPHFPVSTVESHKGELVFGRLGAKEVVAMAGRFHYYEGYSAQEITFPVRVMKAIGVENLIISNASGGLNPHFRPGQIVALSDHINLMPEHPLRGPNDDRLGLRFPDMKYAYSKALLQHAHDAADMIDYQLAEGVYVGFQGPSLETPAEYSFLRKIGGDMVGMSTVPEVIVAKHCELSTLVLSLVSNLCYPPSAIKETSLEDVIEMAKQATPVFCKIVEDVVRRI